MKRKNFDNLWVTVAILIAGLLVASSCEKNNPEENDEDLVRNLPRLEVSISGSISHTTYTKGQSGAVSFNRFLATVTEFKQVRDQIGGEPHGAVAPLIGASLPTCVLKK